MQEAVDGAVVDVPGGGGPVAPSEPSMVKLLDQGPASRLATHLFAKLEYLDTVFDPTWQTRLE